MKRGTAVYYEEIAEHVAGLEIIDTHEHLPAFEHLRERDTDVLAEYLTHYFSCDLISAGLSEADYRKAIDRKLPLMERWDLVEPYWEAARHTGYGKSLDLTARGLYGVERIDRGRIEELNGRFRESLAPGHFRKVLKEKSKIRVSLLHDIPKKNERILFDSNLACDREFFRNVYPIDGLIFPQTWEDIRRVEEQSGVRVCDFTHWLEACEAQLDNALAHGAAALKSGLAYQRPIGYARVTAGDAEREFNDLFGTRHMATYLQSAFTAGRKFQDYVMHFILGLAQERGLTVQFHTGIQEGNGNFLFHSDPSLLSNLFLEYPGVKFDLFHIGYPYQGVVGVLAKNFPNVFIDMCWAHIVSPVASVRALAEWLEVVPVNKISAFGGDYLFVDGVYGHQAIARANVSASLAEKVEAGTFSVDRAKEIAQMLFIENPVRIFNLGDLP